MFFIFPISDLNPTRKKPIITITLILICFIIFLWQESLNIYSLNDLILSYGMIPSVLFGLKSLPPEISKILPPFTIISSLFLHGGWLHIISNMGYLYIFGDNIEDSMGKVRFIIFYILCALIAALSQALLDPQSEIPMIGASGAISGILGGYLVLFPKIKIKLFVWFLIFIKTFYIRAVFILLGWIILQFLNFDYENNNGGVAYAAHIGGFISGMVLIHFFKKDVNRSKMKLSKGTLPESK